MASLLPLLFCLNGPLWEVRGLVEPDLEALSWFELRFFGVKKHQSVSIRKTKEITQWIDQKCMLFDTFCFKNLLLT